MPKHSDMKNKDMKSKEMKSKPKAKKSKKGMNPWMKHVASVRAKNKGKSLKEILMMAKKTYKKK